MDKEGNVTSHLSGLFYRNINFLEHDIKPIYVFDGEASDLKLDTIKERKEIKEDAREKMIEAQDKEDFKEAKKYAQLTSKLNTNMLNESKKLLEYMGIPILDASSEGEAQSAFLVNNGDAWACASQDYDTLLFGCERLVRNFAVSRKKKVKDTTDTLDIEYISLSANTEFISAGRDGIATVVPSKFGIITFMPFSFSIFFCSPERKYGFTISKYILILAIIFCCFSLWAPCR